jgi:hypothetical protein
MPDGSGQHDLDDNIGLLYFLAKKYKGLGRFDRWDVDEIVAEFYLIARRAYDRRFDPKKGSLSRFLTLVITQDVYYRYRRLHGAVRRRVDNQNKWFQLERGFTDEQH